MRQLTVIVPKGSGARVVELARSHEAVNVARWSADGEDGPVDVVALNLNNRRVGDFVDALDGVGDVRINLQPSPIMAMYPPPEDTPRQVTSVQMRSPLEIFLSGWQSVGTWGGLLGYAAASGVVAWIGLLTGAWYLLTASMLIAPYAGPAMTLAIATARGDGALAGRSVARYVGGLATAVAVAGFLTWAFRIEVATPLMLAVGEVARVAPLLAVAAGAAGALAQAESQANSLVSGAAVGILIAASLAPPAALVGIAPIIGDASMLQSALFLLVLQLVGINVGAAAVFRFVGRVNTKGVRYPRGDRRVAIALAVTTLVLAPALVAWQLWDSPELERSSIEHRAVQVVREALDGMEGGHVVEAQASFTRPEAPAQETLVVSVVLQSREGVDEPRDALRERATRIAQDALVDAFPNVTPLVDVTVLAPPSRP